MVNEDFSLPLRRRVRAVLAALFLLTGGVATAMPMRLDPAKPMREYVIAAWRETTGLPVDSIGSVAQTRDGYLWLGTEVGLVRFDGVKFTLFSRENTPAFLSSEVYTLFVSSDGTLWIGTRGGGALTFDGVRFARVPTKLRFIVGFAEARDGSIWIGAPGGAARRKGGEWKHFAKAEGYQGGRLAAIAADDSGAYLAVPPGIVKIDDSGARTWTAADGLSGGVVTSLRMTADGLLAGSENGAVFRLARDGASFVDVVRTPGGHAISSMIEGDQGSLWMSTVGGGIIRYANGSLARLSERDGLTGDSINQLLEDDEGNLWAGVTGGGIVRIKEGRIRTVVPRQPLSGEWILQLIQSRDGSVWFATNGGGLNRMSNGSLARITAADGLASNVITALAEHSDGSIWVGTDRALQRIANGRVVQTVSAEDGLTGSMVLALTVARDGGVWVSTNGGLHHIVRGVVRKLTAKDGLAPGAIIAIREARDGSLWFAKPMTVEHYTAGKLVTFSREDGLRTSSIHSIAIDEKDGSIWVASAGDGLARIRDGRVSMYGTENGLLSNTAYGLVQDRGGNLWIPTNRGLYGFKRSDLDLFENGRIARIPINVFRKADGLKSSDFSGGFDQPGFRAFDGTLWFPTTRGIAVVDPDRIRVDTVPPRAIVESVTADGVTYASGTPIDLPRGRRSLEIAYTSPSFYSPERTTFRYRLDGFDDQWHEAGTRRTAYYTNLPAGKYRFRVQAVSGDGLMREAAPRLIEITPQIHETLLFKAGGALLLLLVGMLLLRRRHEAMRRRQEELLRSEEHFRSLTEHGSDMILVVDTHGTITYVSPSVPRVLGSTVEALTGSRLGDLLAEPAAGAAFLSEVESGGRASATLHFRDSAGMRHEVESIGSAYGSYGRIILNCRDITERRRLEQQLEQANRVASLGRLAATVSHEFNNVLMGIQPFVDILRRSPERNVQQATAHMADSITRGKRITEEILRYTRPAEPTLTPVAVREWLLDFETEIRALIGPNVRLSIFAPPSLTILADVSQLAQVLTNLAINARDAGAKSIRIAAAPTEGQGVFPFGVVRDPHRHAHLRFSDDGGGIPEAILPSIFEPLFTTKKTKGTGLGLAVAQKVVSRHGGEMFVESRVGSGTTFHLFLPIGISAAIPEVPREELVEAGSRPCRILLVEDNPEVAEGIVALLASEGFDVHLAMSGEDALDMIPELSPDVAILDVGLPGIDGIELYRRISSRWPRIGAVFSTAQGDVMEGQEGFEGGPICLTKPYGRDELIAAISATLERRDEAVA